MDTENAASNCKKILSYHEHVIFYKKTPVLYRLLSDLGVGTNSYFNLKKSHANQELIISEMSARIAERSYEPSLILFISFLTKKTHYYCNLRRVFQGYAVTNNSDTSGRTLRSFVKTPLVFECLRILFSIVKSNLISDCVFHS